MKGVGFLVGTIFLVLICAVVYSQCGNPEGFQTRGPNVQQLKEAVPRKDLTELPSAPYSNMPDIPVPAHDPAEAKSKFQALVALKTDMDGFQERVYPYMIEMSDPTVQLPLSRFKGDYQRIKDELLVLDANPALGVQISENEMETIRANLRFLQRTYHTLETNQLVPTNSVEGFTGTPTPFSRSKFDSDSNSYSSESKAITPDELAILNTKLLVEISRLTASGTSDPIIQARINIFSKIQQSVSDIIKRIKDKRLDPTMIPIKKRDYNAFLPALGNTNTGISKLLSSAGLGSLSSLFGSSDSGDIHSSNAQAKLLDRYANSILNGLSYNVSLTYTSPNEVAKEKAKATQAKATQATATEANATQANATETRHDIAGNSRGEFENIIQNINIDDFNDKDSSDVSAHGFDWKKRSQQICKAIGALGLNPSDFGCLEPGAQVGHDYSWRGNARMVCTRAATHSDPGIPEQIGCPPISWKAWRN